MRTTIRLDDDVLAAASTLQRERHLSVSEAVNTLARAGMPRVSASSPRFRQRTAELGITVDVSNIGETLDLLEGADHK